MEVVTTQEIMKNGRPLPQTTLNRTFGITTVSPSAWANYKTSFRHFFGGESKAYTKLIEKSRASAIQKLEENTQQLGGNAVTCLRFDSDCINGDLETVVAYGTAVYVETNNDNSNNNR